MCGLSGGSVVSPITSSPAKPFYPKIDPWVVIFRVAPSSLFHYPGYHFLSLRSGYIPLTGISPSDPETFGRWGLAVPTAPFNNDKLFCAPIGRLPSLFLAIHRLATTPQNICMLTTAITSVIETPLELALNLSTSTSSKAFSSFWIGISSISRNFPGRASTEN